MSKRKRVPKRAGVRKPASETGKVVLAQMIRAVTKALDAGILPRVY